MQSYNYVAADDMAAAALRHENETSNILCKKNSHLPKPKDISQPLTATMVWYSRSRILVPQLLLFFLLWSPAQQPPQLATITITQRQKKVRVSFITPELSLLSPQLFFFFFFLPQLFLLTCWVVMRICKCKKHSTAQHSTQFFHPVTLLSTVCWKAILHVHHHDHAESQSQ